MILAGIDIGTNSLRLLIAEVSQQGFRPLFSDRKSTRLGQELGRTGLLSIDAIGRSIDALRTFQDHIHRFSVDRISAVGTSALRNAANTDLFLKLAREQAGTEIAVISGMDEAGFMLRGVRAALAPVLSRQKHVPDQTLVIDIGGGSTEFIAVTETGAPIVMSLDLGAVYLHDRCITSDPPGQDEIGRIRQEIGNQLEKIPSTLSFLNDPARRPPLLIGAAGTITTLASIDQSMEVHDPDRINGSELTSRAVKRIVDMLSRLTLAERRAIPGLEPGREDIILPGGLIALEIMERYGYGTMFVSDWGVREGIILDLYDRAAAG